MIRLITPTDIGLNYGAMVSMHRLRYRIFKERLNWEVATSGNLEVDVFDTMRPIYVIHEDEDGSVDGCVRLLPTTGPYMLREVFPCLLGDIAAPVGARIWEASRFAIDPCSRSPVSRRAVAQSTLELFLGVLEFGLAWNLTNLVAVVDLRFERVLRRGGWPLQRFGRVQQLGDRPACAGLLEISEAVLDRVRGLAEVTAPLLPSPYSKVA